MSATTPQETTYNASEVNGLEDAFRIVCNLQCDRVYLQPAWQKLFHIKEYLKARQTEVLADTLSDPGVL
jgi:hypothetical protein